MTESFRKTWRGWIQSSEGYSVRLMGRTRLEYVDAQGNLTISAEAMSKPWSDIVVYASTIRDTEERPSSLVVDRLSRAFAFAGWRLIISDQPGTAS